MTIDRQTVDRQTLKRLVRVGAEQRLRQIIDERHRLERFLRGSAVVVERPHWAQTPEGRQRMSEAIKRSWAIRKQRSLLLEQQRTRREREEARGREPR